MPKSVLVTALKAAVSIALISVLVLRAGAHHLFESLRDVDTKWLITGTVLGWLGAMLQANQLRGLLSAVGLYRAYLPCLRLDTAARLFDAALPSNIGGDVVRVHLLGDGRRAAAPAALAVLLRRVMSLPGLLILMASGLAISWSLPYSGRIRVLAFACLIGGVLAAAILGVAYRIGRSSKARLPGPVTRLVESLRAARERAVPRDRRPFLRAALRGLVYWIAVVLSQWAYIRAVGIHAPAGYAMAVITCVNAVSMVPISLGGYGLREGAFSALLGVHELGTPAQGAAVGVCLSAQTLLFGLVGGVVYLGLGRGPRRTTVRTVRSGRRRATVRPEPEPRTIMTPADT